MSIVFDFIGEGNSDDVFRADDDYLNSEKDSNENNFSFTEYIYHYVIRSNNNNCSSYIEKEFENQLQNYINPNPKIKNIENEEKELKNIEVESKDENKTQKKNPNDIDGNTKKNQPKKIKSKKNKFIIRNRHKIRRKINNIIFLIFKIKKKSEKSSNMIIRRRDKSDNIRKKIKVNFLNSLKKKINNNLLKANSTKLFKNFPQCFKEEINKKKNKLILNKTLKEIISTNFYDEYNKKKKDDKKSNYEKLKSSKCVKDGKKAEPPDIKKYKNNLEVLEYLEKEKDICKESKFDIFGNMTYKDLFAKYLKSKEYEDDIASLGEKKRYNNKKHISESATPKYINDYIIKSRSFIEYFSK